jgi:hypothetical protein
MSNLTARSLKVIREQGFAGFLKKATGKLKISVPRPTRDPVAASGELRYPVDMARRWLSDNRINYSNAVYVMVKHLVFLNEQLQSVRPVACREYRDYFMRQFMLSGFPFEVDTPAVEERPDIIDYINEYDRAHLSKMIKGVFIGLIRHLIAGRDSIGLLDFGSGQTCGMYGENGRFLFEEGDVDIDSVRFTAIDEVHKPSGAIFPNSSFSRCAVTSFSPEERLDLITGHHVLEHCFNWEDVIVHLSGLLREDGYLYLSFPRCGGFYDTTYRIMSGYDHCACFDLGMLQTVAETTGLQTCLSDVYVDPNTGFDWMFNIFEGLVSREMAACFYDLCVAVDARLLLGYHHYGHYIVFRKRKP